MADVDMADVDMADVDMADVETAAPPAVRPYGPLGLVVSIVVMLLLTAFYCAAMAGAFALVDALIFGRGHLIDLLDDASGAFASSDRARVMTLGATLGSFIYLAAVAALFTLAWQRGRARWRDLLAWRGFALASAWVWLTIFAVAYGLLAGLVIVRVYPQARGWVVLPRDAFGLGATFIVAVVMAPLAEELLFRGWIYTALRSRFSFAATLVVTALLFAMAHVEHTGLYALAVFPVGLILGYARERFGSVRATVAIHAVYNFAALLAKLVLPD